MGRRSKTIDQCENANGQQGYTIPNKAYSGVWYRCYSKLYLSKTEVLLAADRTWGDPVPAVDAMQLFVECGAAHVAGFLDCPKVTNKVRAYGKPRPKKEKK